MAKGIVKFGGGQTDWQKRAIETHWLTNVADPRHRGGIRQVTLTVHHHDGEYTVAAMILTRVNTNDGYSYTVGTLMEDPYVVLQRERGRFSAKRLANLFDEWSATFDAEEFYAAREREKFTEGEGA